MSDNGRLIINERGETVQVLPAVTDRRRKSGWTVILQVFARDDRIAEVRGGKCSELALSRPEASALILKLADAIGVACELREKPRG